MSTTSLTAPPAGFGEAGRIAPRAHLRHIGALARRNALQIKQDPQSMGDAVLAPILLTLLFVYVFGGAVSGGDRRAYVNYVMPGLLAMTGLNIALAVGVGVNTDFATGVMDRFRAMPIARSSVLIAKVVVETGRVLVATGILLGMAFLLGMEVRTSALHLLAAVALALLFGASLMWIFIWLGLVLRSAQAVQGLGLLVLMPLQFGSSIFAPTSTMPGWLRSFTDVNPLSNLADAVRNLVNGGPVAHSVWVTLAWSAGLVLVAAPLAVARFRDRTS
ncbi:ABC transporter permease [Streptomyces sp. URMC 123]|uniref:ABC transporter permease n=1 Tax=Streptomyces sp. URMC 123 TaxID=3423403 RepID=UPI003F1CCBF3